ncbi:MAG: hypothetical protein PHS57_01085 [Alphaproteobacteria bacterium]|nr:hypothetical protein [Alphaproteobacteria bacterium]
MTKDEQLRLSLLLAFQAVITHGGKIEGDAEKRILGLAQRMNEFCDLQLKQAFPEEMIKLVDDKGAAEIDDAIAIHIENLRTKSSTQLPQDKESLIQLYDRLQQRKSRRMQWQFYATAKEEKVADLILQLLDDEIEDLDAGAKQ